MEVAHPDNDEEMERVNNAMVLVGMIHDEHFTHMTSEKQNFLEVVFVHNKLDFVERYLLPYQLCSVEVAFMRQRRCSLSMPPVCPDNSYPE
jgi:hypothetical protein